MLKISKIKVMLSSLALLIFLPMAAQAQVYGVSLNGFNSSNPGTSSLYTIDPVSGAGTYVGDIDNVATGYAVNAIAIDPTSGIMYASTTSWSGPFNGLLTLNMATGEATEVGPFGAFTSILGLTFDSSGQLWGWHDPSADDAVRIDKATGAATTVGNSGVGTGQQVMAFDSADTLIMVQGTQVYTIDQVTGAAVLTSSLSFDPGSGGAAFDFSSGLLWAARGSGRDQDSWIRLSDLAGDTFTDLDTDVEYLNAVTAGSDLDDLQGTLRVNVTKVFTDGSTDEVDVTLTCNGGLPLVQDFTIAGDGPGVTFVVTDLPPTGATCTLTESGGPDGYTPVMNGGAGCSWDGVTGGLQTCVIANEADPATFIVNKVWEVNVETGDDVIRVADITITCDAEIQGGYQDDDDRSEKELPGGIPMPPGYGDWMLDETIVGDGSVEATVDTSMGPVMCEAEETSEQSGVESTDDCGPREIGAGETSECTITNTVFFEGIPSLNQYGLAIMALLMLGLGLVGFRRLV